MADYSSKKGLVFYLKRIFGLVLLLALAAVFLFSSYSKLQALEAFQWTFIDMGVSNATFAAVIAYIFIGLEFLLGLFLLAHIYLKQFTYPATIAMLLALTIYLILLIIKQGNTGNCGCFGDWIYMKPLSAIWKNIAMIAATVLLMFIYPVKPYKNQEFIAVLIAMAAMVTPFIIEPLGIGSEPARVHEDINLSPLYVQGIEQPKVNLREGKHIVAFMSLTCPHCRKAAYFLHVLKKQQPSLPVYFILSGHPDNLKDFFDESKAGDVPYILFLDKDEFIEMAGDYVPSIYWVNNSVIERKSSYKQLQLKGINKWLAE